MEWRQQVTAFIFGTLSLLALFGVFEEGPRAAEEPRWIPEVYPTWAQSLQGESWLLIWSEIRPAATIYTTEAATEQRRAELHALEAVAAEIEQPNEYHLRKPSGTAWARVIPEIEAVLRGWEAEER